MQEGKVCKGGQNPPQPTTPRPARPRGRVAQNEPDADPVNHPQHYRTATGIECIQVIEALGLDYHLGNALKYLWRAGRKDGQPAAQDLAKAAWYIQRKIEQITE